jgi:biopolymer transport protein ExbD
MKIQFQFAPKKLISLNPMIIGGLLFLSLTLSACSTIRLQLSQFTRTKSTLPRDMKFADEDFSVMKETSCVITVNDDSGNFLIAKEQTSKNQLTEKISKAMTDKSRDRRIVYVEASENLKYQTIVELFIAVRKADVDKAGLVVTKVNNEKPGAKPTTFQVKLPDELTEHQPITRPNPLLLVVEIDRTKNLTLNKESVGNINETNGLMNKLTNVFKQRESEGIFREGTNEIEKTTTIKASRSATYGDVAKMIDAVKGAGAEPINIQIDDLRD